MLADLPLHDLLDKFGAPSPTPGAGGATAAAAALGVALLQMVSGLPKTKTGAPAERAALDAAAPALAAIRRGLLDAMDADAAAYDAVIDARRQPRGTDAEREARDLALQAAMRHATDTPLGILRLAAAALEQATIVGAHGHTAAAGEVGVAVTLLRAARKAARVCVEINLNEVKDAGYRAMVAAEIRETRT